MTKETRYQQHLTDTFLEIDSLGNYSHREWYASLSHTKIIRFIQELKDIWAYRANLTQEVKQQIIGLYDPFTTLSVGGLIPMPFYEVKIVGLNIIDKFISGGINRDSKALGAIYVLSALTLVNHDAAAAMPHLYESVI